MSKTIWSLIGIIVLVAIITIARVSIDTTPAPAPAAPDVSRPAELSLVAPGAGTVEVGDLQDIRWTATNYGAATVAISVIRKVSDNPARYELVRTVALATAADGEAVWVPATTDAGSNTFIQVGCALSAQECRGTQPTMALAVVDTGRYANTAAAYQAIEREENN